jgi:hypothetical protein
MSVVVVVVVVAFVRLWTRRRAPVVAPESIKARHMRARCEERTAVAMAGVEMWGGEGEGHEREGGKAGGGREGGKER